MFFNLESMWGYKDHEHKLQAKYTTSYSPQWKNYNFSVIIYITMQICKDAYFRHQLQKNSICFSKVLFTSTQTGVYGFFHPPLLCLLQRSEKENQFSETFFEKFGGKLVKPVQLQSVFWKKYVWIVQADIYLLNANNKKNNNRKSVQS